MTSQDEFIASVRDRLSDGIPPNPLRPLQEAANGPIEYTTDLTDIVDRFRRAAIEAGAEIIGAPDEPIDRILHQVLEIIEPHVVTVSKDPECDGIEHILSDAGIEIAPPNDLASVASADLGITGAITGVALTGSLVVNSRRATGRLVSLLPKAHLALVPTPNIVPTPGDVLRNMAEWFPDGLPSNLVFITGPSRSADIELQITKGVHGPERLLIACR
jgi:L-lactate dehydrogenase complex protein LldG